MGLVVVEIVVNEDTARTKVTKAMRMMVVVAERL